MYKTQCAKEWHKSRDQALTDRHAPQPKAVAHHNKQERGKDEGKGDGSGGAGNNDELSTPAAAAAGRGGGEGRGGGGGSPCGNMNKLLYSPATEGQASIWPLPLSYINGSRTIHISTDLTFQASIPSELLNNAFHRYYDLIFSHRQKHTTHPGHRVHSSLSSSSPSSLSSYGNKDRQLCAMEEVGKGDGLRLVSVIVLTSSEKLQLETDESYLMEVPDSEEGEVLIMANNVYGVLRALETFSQLCTYNFATKRVQIKHAPWVIRDSPRFPHRGLLIDTSRHFQPLATIKGVVDSMSYAKLNVLHWHLVDTESFPLEVPKYPSLWDGAFSSQERYTTEDVEEIVEYARQRGVRVMVELDVPGHAASWGVGYGDVWPSVDCKQPLDVSNKFTTQLVDGVLDHLSRVFDYKLLHLGGDEVDTTCWDTTPRIRSWLNATNITSQAAYLRFVRRAQRSALTHGRDPVNWEDTFNTFGRDLDNRTIVQTWLTEEAVAKVVGAGLRCIASYRRFWYLDDLKLEWENFYGYEPLKSITRPQEQALVLGGEVCMWGETVDPSDIFQTIWPRAAAAAERLWSPRHKTDRYVEQYGEVSKRLKRFRCLLTQRGVAAAPVESRPRSPPRGPGSCFTQ
ncbi:hypothetical protein CBR_g32276 [Chara braunii]|uniref:Beta-hexosaminidase n=1 Tax=Chara braunii TaxID=69332 RepID=A0A388JNA7_CHABU|nr:hypothetical protein CBR_g32276 [Chara braunii]|eukprot:GBG59261.1 hypothetical protein CBR_g32276 [Chara braunii]